VTRLKTTNQIVHVLESVGPNHVNCLILNKDGRITNSGNRGTVQTIRKDKLIEEGADYLSAAIKERN
jgi:hypothetical protein